MISNAYFIEGISVRSREIRSCIPNIRVGSSVWQNPTNRYDVIADSLDDTGVLGEAKVGPADYAALQNWLEENGEHELPPVRPSDAPYLDVNGDGWVTYEDLIMLSRYINEGQHESFDEEDCFAGTGLSIVRDLITPETGLMVREVGIRVNAHPYTDFRPYRRNFHTNRLTEVSPTALADVKDSLVFIHNDLFQPLSVFAKGCSLESGIVGRLQAYFANSSEILPARSVWP